jgi:hypothetical protein
MRVAVRGSSSSCTGDGSDNTREDLGPIRIPIVPTAVPDVIAASLTKLSTFLSGVPTCITQVPEFPATLVWGISATDVPTLAAHLVLSSPEVATLLTKLHGLNQAGVRT